MTVNHGGLSKRWQRALCMLVACSTFFTTAVQSQIRQDGQNDEQISVAGHYNVSAVGFYYTPTATYWLNRVETYFSTAAYYPGCCGIPIEREVTLELLTAPRSDGGVLLRSAVFNSLEASGQYGGPTFSPLFMSAGTTYFVGFLNVLALGANLSFEATTPHRVFRFDWSGRDGVTGQYAETQNLFDLRSTVYRPPPAFQRSSRRRTPRSSACTGAAHVHARDRRVQPVDRNAVAARQYQVIRPRLRAGGATRVVDVPSSIPPRQAPPLTPPPPQTRPAARPPSPAHS